MHMRMRNITVDMRGVRWGMTRRLQAWARLGGPSGTCPAGCRDAVGLCICTQCLYHMCMHMRMRNITVDMRGVRWGMTRRLQACQWARLGGPSGTCPAGCRDAVGLCVCIQRLYHVCMHMRMCHVSLHTHGVR